MALIVMILTLITGMAGLSLWLSLPLGFLIFWGAYRVDPQQTTRLAPTAMITFPIGALIIMLIGRAIVSVF